MDDVYLFGKSQQEVNADFNRILRLIGQKGLSVNSSKTSLFVSKAEKTDESISDIKKNFCSVEEK